jgi:hypothetical protein
MKSIFNVKVLLSLGILLMVPVCMFAHGGHNPPGGGGGGYDVPLDGGLSLLAAAGIGYGVKKVTAKKKQVK